MGVLGHPESFCSVMSFWMSLSELWVCLSIIYEFLKKSTRDREAVIYQPLISPRDLIQRRIKADEILLSLAYISTSLHAHMEARLSVETSDNVCLNCRDTAHVLLSQSVRVAYF
jgi:hypothetical protein